MRPRLHLLMLSPCAPPPWSWWVNIKKNPRRRRWRRPRFHIVIILLSRLQTTSVAHPASSPFFLFLPPPADHNTGSCEQISECTCRKILLFPHSMESARVVVVLRLHDDGGNELGLPLWDSNLKQQLLGNHKLLIYIFNYFPLCIHAGETILREVFLVFAGKL